MNLIEIEGDFMRADQIAAICVSHPDEDDDDEKFSLRVSLIGVEADIVTDFDTAKEAKSAQVKAVKAWQEAMA